MNLLLKIVLITMLSLFSLEISAQESADTSRNKIPDEVLQVARNSNMFALDLYRQSRHANNNICFSPYSITSAFAMVYAGAKGDTHKEMASVLHYPLSTEKLNSGWAWLTKFLTLYPSNSSEDIRLRVANSLWLQTNFPILPSFRDTMSKYFNGTFRFVDFKTQTETARTVINAWVKQNTFGKITDILTAQSLDSTTRMVLVSALYLKAKWKNQFDVHATSQQPFYPLDGSSQTVLSMTQTGPFPYLDTPEAAILEMPYIMSRKEGPEFSMLCVLPHLKEGLPDVEMELTVDKLEDWINNLENTRAIVTIPKFKVLESSNLQEQLTQMGMDLPFSDQADFSDISGIKGLKIGNVMHKVYLSVDETGSEAAAATTISMNLTSVLDKKPPIVFQVDHPFLYIIFEKTTGMILFIGRITDL